MKIYKIRSLSDSTLWLKRTDGFFAKGGSVYSSKSGAKCAYRGYLHRNEWRRMTTVEDELGELVAFEATEVGTEKL